MSYATRNEAIASLRCFTPYIRKAHVIVRFWSDTYNAYRYACVFGKA
jgi:hypothetical protein